MYITFLPQLKMSADDMTPKLPSHLLNKSSKSDSDSGSEEEFYGPKPPPRPSALSSENKYVGPALPPAHVLAKFQESTGESTSYSKEHSSSSDEDKDTIGPMPGGSNYELEKRAIELKMSKISGDGSDSKPESTSREEWMLELPQVNSVAGMGLTARQFRTKERPDFSDRSSWTDTPDEREKKAKGPTEKEIEIQKEREKRKQRIAMRDEEQEKIVKRHKKKHKRDKSLMEIHEKKMKKKKKVVNF